MATLKCNSDCVVVTVKDESVVYNFDSGNVSHLKFNRTQKTNTHSKLKNSSDKNIHAYESVFMPCSDISHCGRWFAFAVDKCLLLWKTSNWSLVGNGILQRSPTKITFTPDGNKLIVADKGGDIYVFLKDNLENQGFLLGHLSLLFDVLITEDEKYIISCDRDEKIRVSCYPNAYNIKAYCLGHEEFVTCVKIIPHCKNVLISASGDGTLRFWDFEKGNELMKYSCFNDLSKKDVGLDIDIGSEHYPIIKFETFFITKSSSGVCVLFDNYNGFLTYIVEGSDSKLTCHKQQSYYHKDSMLDLFVSNDLLWLVSFNVKCEVFALQWNNVSMIFENDISNGKINDAIVSVNRCLNDIKVSVRSSFSVLYKKYFENVQEYYKRKNDVLCESTKKNKNI